MLFFSSFLVKNAKKKKKIITNKHYMDKSMTITPTGTVMTSHWSSLCSYNIFHSILEKFSTRVSHLSGRAFVRSSIGIGWGGLAGNICSSSSQRCSMGMRSGLGYVRASQVLHIQPCLNEPCFVHSHAGIEKGLT